ncbi:protein translocase subunit SecF [Halobacteria archaeon AArc-m2/3/4]|uniref:Protein-export membrane protein SecF n=1 Tax=Natronoglomus mannanivorans TaxID=2979990 RepID=A0AAP2YW87_9EURY|nr:protein translocase subunit SecF [Halobacteria archaeon AArc-xg1-1]MCU4972702.1 protein translocase subunit SecF [Halobacteria archaeon AArc-m2/3/4]
MGYFDVPEIDYTRYSNRQLAAVPLAVLAVALAILGGWYVFTGAPVGLGIEFAGGTELTVDTATDESDIPDAFDEEVSSIQSVQTEDNRYIVQFTSTDDEALREQAESNLEPLGGNDGVVMSGSSTSASFGAQTQQTALYGIGIAFVGMSVFAFILFRTFVPSVAIVVSAFSDIVIPLAFMNLAGIPLTLGTVAALLLLIGYSVDSDILLNNSILRRSGDFYESTHRAMRTGVTMTVTSMAAMLVMAISATLFGVELLASVGLILFVGLAADLMNTYMLNLSMLRWYKFKGVNR